MKRFFAQVLSLLSLSLHAQDSLRRSDVYRFADASLYTYSQPIRWSGKDWLTLGGVIGGTAALTLLDEPIRTFFVRTKASFPAELDEIGYHYGKPYAAFAFTGGFYLVGLIINDRWAKDTGINLGATLLTSGLIQTLLKDVVGRARPSTETGAYDFIIPAKGHIGYHSFPSGHVAVALGISMVLAKRIDYVPVKILLYSLAATTAISRMYSDAHWFSDLAFGVALAYYCNQTVVRRLGLDQKASTNRNRQKISWNFNFGGNGIAVTGRF